jgi:hypothetical protein
MRFDDELSANESLVREHVRTLGRARLEHPAMWSGRRTTWWENERDVLAYARVTDDDAVIVAIHRGDGSRTLENGLAFAGLPEGTYRDILSGDTFTSDGDRLRIELGSLQSRVLVHE